MRGGGRLADLGPGAEALVDKALGAELLDRLVVVAGASALARQLPVPVDPERAQVVELSGHELLAAPLAVEVLHPEQQLGVLGAGEEPGEDGRAEIAEVELAAGGGGVAAGAVHVLQDRAPVGRWAMMGA